MSAHQRVTALAVPAFGLFVGCLVLALTFSIRDSGQTIYGPRFWPFLIAAALITINLVGLMIRLSVGAEPERLSNTAPAKALASADWFAIGALLLYPLIVQVFGFLFGSAVFLLIFLPATGYRHAPSVLAISLVASLAVTFFFTKVAYMPLPKGVGWIGDATIAALRSMSVL